MRLAYAISASPTRFAAVAQTGDLAGTMRMLAGLGFAGVELAVRDPSALDLEAVAAVVRDLGVAVPAIGTGQAYLEEELSLTAPDPGRREGAVSRLLAQVETARRFEAVLIVGLIHGPIPRDTDRTEALDRLLGGLGRVARAARPAGVRLVIEPINRYESNWLNTVDEVLDVIARLGEDNVGVLPDTFHMNIEEGDPAAAIRAAGTRLWHFHAADSNRLAPGWGHLDFGAAAAVLAGAAYGGWVSAEVLQRPSLEAAARQTLAALSPLDAG